MARTQQELIDILNNTQDFEDEDKGYQRYKRREAFEAFLFSSDGLEFCGCGSQDDSLQAVVNVLEYCALDATQDRSDTLFTFFGVWYVHEDALLQILFYLLDNKGFIHHSDEDEVNESELTTAGRLLLPMLREYLSAPAEPSYF